MTRRTDAANAVARPASGIAVRLLMPLRDADILGAELLGSPTDDRIRRLLDQLWLRSVMIKQWRRTPRAERVAFEARANNILGSLDPDIKIGE